MVNDELHVDHAHAVGLDVHKQHITATVRLCAHNSGEPTTRQKKDRGGTSGARRVDWAASRNPDRVSVYPMLKRRQGALGIVVLAPAARAA